jgi:ribonuclease HI
MPATNSDRSKHFAAIEKKHGEKATVWLKLHCLQPKNQLAQRSPCQSRSVTQI